MSRILHVYAGEAVHGSKRFRPQGRLYHYGPDAAPNPTTRLSGGGLSARLFVGLKVGQRTRWTVNDVVAIVAGVRKRQGKSADASILAQKGIYEDRKGKLVIEPSVQIILIDLVGEKKAAFVRDVNELAEELRSRLKQEVVIVEIQRRGVVTDVYSVSK